MNTSLKKQSTFKANRQRQNKILLGKPQPLYSKKHNLALFFSAKAGCTWAVKWFFFQTDFLDNALFYHPWIHEFRIKVFYQSSEYEKNITSITYPETRVIKVVRNPYKRVVSSYIHAAKCGYENEKIADFLGRTIDQEESFSFREFISYLGNINLKACNIHHRLQLHPAEEKGLVAPDRIIHLENSLEQIREVEEEYDLRSSNFEELRQSSHHTLRSENTEFCGDKRFCFYPQTRTPIPNSSSFYDDSLKKDVLNIYRLDFEAYNYDIDTV